MTRFIFNRLLYLITKEITNIDYGKEKETPEDVNLLDMEFD